MALPTRASAAGTSRPVATRGRQAASIVPEGDFLGLPPVRPVDPAVVAGRVASTRRSLVVLDDDPTGTQTVAGIPVLTAWSVEDIRWAMRQDSSTFYILTNTRSLDADHAASRNREVAASIVDAARVEGRRFAVVSRGDSTLRGHFPLETDVLAESLTAFGGPGVDGVVLCPSYVDAGRVTVGDVHWMRTSGGLIPVGASEFARDATFGYRSSNLREYIEEKSGGRWRAGDVLSVGLDDIRLGGEHRVADMLGSLRGGRPAVVNALCDDDLRVVALAALAVEERGHHLLYRTGPSFVRARAGQQAHPPLSSDELYGRAPRAKHGLLVIGSHVALTTRQLDRLRRSGGIHEIDLDVAALLAAGRPGDHVESVARSVLRDLDTADVVVSTTRQVVTGPDAAVSLAISRQVSRALVDVVRAVVTVRTPRFVVAKGGITSSDVATDGLGIRRAWVRGTLQPGIVSVWSPADGRTPGIPYVVFAGNVGDDHCLARVVGTLRGGR